MEKIIFFGLIIPILIFIVYLGGRAIMTGFSAKNSNQSNTETGVDDNQENSNDTSENLSTELNKLNRSNEYVFEGKKPNTHIKSVRKTWRKACELANISGLDLYDLRKTFSSNATKTFGLFDSSKLTNHKSTKVVEKHYSHLDSGETKERKDQLSEKFNNLLNGGGKVIGIERR